MSDIPILKFLRNADTVRCVQGSWDLSIYPQKEFGHSLYKKILSLISLKIKFCELEIHNYFEFKRLKIL